MAHESVVEQLSLFAGFERIESITVARERRRTGTDAAAEEVPPSAPIVPVLTAVPDASTETAARAEPDEAEPDEADGAEIVPIASARGARLSVARVVADNLAVVELLDLLRTQGRAPTEEEREVLSRWHGFGAAPQFFEDPAHATARQRFQELVGLAGYDAARRGVLNAHYSDHSLIEAMWRATAAFGVERGSFIEPGCGRGGFLALAPEGFHGLGVEIDPTTAEVCRLLSPTRHRVLAADFASLPVGSGVAALAIGNVPFGRLGCYDRVWNPTRRLSIHDHFLVKALSMLAPGGLALFITSRFTLDKQASFARRTMGELADFLGAVRLPASTHAAEAGTSVVSDIVAFRRRAAGEAAQHAEGFLDRVVELEGSEGATCSAYIAAHPAQVLGTLGIASSPFGPALTVSGPPPSADALYERLAVIAQSRPACAPSSAQDDLDALCPSGDRTGPVGRISIRNGTFVRVGEAGEEPFDPGRDGKELSALVELRDLVESLVAMEDRDEPDAQIEARRAQLRDAWTRYTATFGPINRVRVDEATGRRRRPRMGGFRSDPSFVRVAALERYDEATGTAQPASLLTGRMLTPPVTVERAASPEEALGISLAERGRLDVDLIAALLDISVAQVPAALGDLCFIDPVSGEVLERPAYLSGNVRRKLAQAEAAAASDPSFARNVAALASVVPPPVEADDLSGVIGAPWISDELVTQFAHTLVRHEWQKEHVSVAYVASSGEWIVSCPEWLRDQLCAGHEFGIAEMDALRVLSAALNGRSPIVTRRDEQNRSVVLADATQAAIEKAQLLSEAFDDWLLHSDPARAAAALAVYNDRFNAHAPRPYDGMGVPTPGLAADFELRPHQKAAIARIVCSGNSAIWHEVGTGKTAILVAAGMEMRRLGLITRPCYVVANNMLEQFAADLSRLYPAAEVLVVDKDDMNPRNRALFAARVRSHDFDAVVITHASFSRWPVAPEIEQDYRRAKLAELEEELRELRTAERANRSATQRAVKAVERQKAHHDAMLQAISDRLRSRQDDHAICFDNAGIDCLFIDEADVFKNGELHSGAQRLRGVPIGPGSQRAFDLSLKLFALSRRGSRRYVVEATGTPISNTIAELWVFMSQLRPDLLSEAGIASFDAFRATFAETTSAMELDVTRHYRRVERLARYKALPELSRLLAQFADIVTADDLGLERPALATGHRQVVSVTPAPALEAFITGEVAERADRIRSRAVEPDEDNWLKLSGDARFASFDWTAFRGEDIPDAHSTIAAAAQNIAGIYHAHKEQRYRSSGGLEHPRPGALQLVFSDLSTPGGAGKHCAYDQLRGRLVELGVPKDAVRYAHEFSTDEAREHMAEMARDGRIAVLIGSTAKLGVGVNVQDRAIALHHLDCPWRPRDIEQREGRILRQGNQNREVEIFAYVVQRSFAVTNWQTVERKASFIGQVLRATLDGPRSLVVTDAEALSFGQIKAVATGDEDFLRLAEAEEEVARLERLERSHIRQRATLRVEADAADTRAARLRTLAGESREVVARIAAVAEGEPWALAIDGEVHDSVFSAAAHLAKVPIWHHEPVRVGGCDIGARLRRSDDGLRIDAIIPGLSVYVVVNKPGVPGLATALRQFVKELRRLPERVESAEEGAREAEAAALRARAALCADFAHRDELHAARAAVCDLRALLERRYGVESSTGTTAGEHSSGGAA